ncbi:MAG: hypothetical protein ACRD32_02240, partial [Nitrososphaerales archaeon]
IAGHIYFQARAISSNVHIRYQTPKGPRHGALVYIKAFEDRYTDAVVIVEGPFDSLSVASCGYDSIALMGMVPGELALNHLVTLVAKRPAIISLDNEPEAKAAGINIGMKLASTGSTTHIESVRGVKDIAVMKAVARQKWLDQRMNDLVHK